MRSVEELRSGVNDAFKGGPPEISKSGEFPDLTSTSDANKKWYRLEDVFVVAVDLKNSTKLGTDNYDSSTARIYKASTGEGAALLQSFNPAFLEIQGDGFFGVFHGDERGICAMTAAMMLAHFSKYILTPEIKKKNPTFKEETGLKVGVASGRVLVSKIGPSGSATPVWAGKPVNYASKCAEAGQAHQVIVTKVVLDKTIKDNDYLFEPCYHKGHPRGKIINQPPLEASMWKYVAVPGLAETCCARDIPWCDGGESIGEETAQAFANQVLSGAKSRNKSWADRNL